MTEQQEKFLRLAVIDQLNYDEIEKKLGIPRKIFAPWWNALKKEREYLSIIRKIWSDKCPEINYYIFKDWYENADRKCFYCGITESEINKLWKRYPKLTKRKRGKKLEIDRKEPNQSDTVVDNLVFSCYWCNNAKTDTFSSDEFKHIGKEINKIWEKRLEE